MKTGQEIPEYNHQHFSGHYLYSAPTMHSDMQMIKYIQLSVFKKGIKKLTLQKKRKIHLIVVKTNSSQKVNDADAVQQ